MSTNFFEDQKRAQNRTVILVILFVVVVALVSTIVGYIVYAFGMVVAADNSLKHSGTMNLSFVRPLFFWAQAGTAVFIGSVTLFSISQLRDGGDAVADMFGARVIEPNTEDLHEKRLINVVEEMAIASGTPVPRVFVLDNEGSLNAFAAGFDPYNASITVTRGGMETWGRDELQGVIGHEFSHILNGDMGLNVKLAGAVAGLTLVAEIGQAIVRGTNNSGSYRSRDEEKDEAAFVLAGLAIIVVGYLGVFFARVLQMAVGRKREELADASSVQFTRNPDGLASALAKILFGPGSEIQNKKRYGFSHFFFADGLGGSLFASHPPLEERIEYLDSRFLEKNFALNTFRAKAQAQAPTAAPSPMPPPGKSAIEYIMASVGQLGMAQIRASQQMLGEIPPDFRAAMKTPAGAKAALLALLLSETESDASGELAQLLENHDTAAAQTARQVYDFLKDKGRDQRINILYLIMPALKPLPDEDRREILDGVRKLILSRDPNVFLWCLAIFTEFSLFPSGAVSPGRRFANIDSYTEDLSYLLHWMCCTGSMAEGQIRDAFCKSWKSIGSGAAPALGEAKFELRMLVEHLFNLTRLPPLWKERVVQAVWDAISFDGRVEPPEAEAARVVCAILGVPIPPLRPLQLSATNQ